MKEELKERIRNLLYRQRNMSRVPKEVLLQRRKDGFFCLAFSEGNGKETLSFLMKRKDLEVLIEKIKNQLNFERELN